MALSGKKAYQVRQLAELAHISVRTLHFYDETGLLRPSEVQRNGYRLYGEAELLRLQQILFFRELDFSLTDIKKILDAPGFDMVEALRGHKRLIELKRQRLDGLLKTIDKTIKNMNDNKNAGKDAAGAKPLDGKDLYGGFTKEEMEKHKQEAKQRWGHTDAWKQSQERTKNWTKDDYARVKREQDALMEGFVANRAKGFKSAEVQALVGKWRDGLRQFYEPSLEMCRGLANMYVQDERFKANYEKFGEGMAEFMREAVLCYCDQQEK